MAAGSEDPADTAYPGAAGFCAATCEGAGLGSCPAGRRGACKRHARSVARPATMTLAAALMRQLEALAAGLRPATLAISWVAASVATVRAYAKTESRTASPGRAG